MEKDRGGYRVGDEDEGGREPPAAWRTAPRLPGRAPVDGADPVEAEAWKLRALGVRRGAQRADGAWALVVYASAVGPGGRRVEMEVPEVMVDQFAEAWVEMRRANERRAAAAGKVPS